MPVSIRATTTDATSRKADSLAWTPRDVEAFLPRLRRFCLTLWCNYDDAVELAEQVREHAIGNTGDWQSSTRLDSWLFTLARGFWTEELRRRRRLELKQAYVERAGRTRFELLDPNFGNRVAIRMLKLPQGTASALLLVLGEHKTYSDAALILDVPTSTVRARLAQARQALRPPTGSLSALADKLEDLSACLDGELPPEMAAQFAHNPAATEELTQMSELNDEIRACFDAILAALHQVRAKPPLLAERRSVVQDSAHARVSVLAHSNASAEPGSRRKRFGPIAATLVLLGIGAGTVAWGTLSSDFTRNVKISRSINLQDAIADNHRFYSRQSKLLVDFPATERDLIEARLAEATGVKFFTPSLANQGLTFEGARLFLAKSTPVGQLLYSDATGGIYSLYFNYDPGPTDAGTATPVELKQVTRAEMTMLSWQTGSGSFVFAGPSGANLTPLARQAAHSM